MLVPHYNLVAKAYTYAEQVSQWSWLDIPLDLKHIYASQIWWVIWYE